MTKQLAKSQVLDIAFMVIAVMSQIIVFIFCQTDIISAISALCGCISVVLCSQKKMSFYWFGFVQLLTYIWIVIQGKLYGELVENLFYLITMIAGVAVWIKNYDKSKSEVKAKQLNKSGHIWCASGLFVGVFVLYFILTYTNDPEPFLDAVSTVPAFIAQILMILCYKEQWSYWFVVDIATLILWINMGNPFMIAQYCFWLANCIYGSIKWSK